MYLPLATPSALVPLLSPRSNPSLFLFREEQAYKRPQRNMTKQGVIRQNKPLMLNLDKATPQKDRDLSVDNQVRLSWHSHYKECQANSHNINSELSAVKLLIFVIAFEIELIAGFIQMPL